VITCDNVLAHTSANYQQLSQVKLGNSGLVWVDDRSQWSLIVRKKGYVEIIGKWKKDIDEGKIN
jgi:hypothetical protein